MATKIEQAMKADSEEWGDDNRPFIYVDLRKFLPPWCSDYVKVCMQSSVLPAFAALFASASLVQVQCDEEKASFSTASLQVRGVLGAR